MCKEEKTYFLGFAETWLNDKMKESMLKNLGTKYRFEEFKTTSIIGHTPPERCLGFLLNNTKMDFTVLILHVHSIQNWFRLNPTCGFP